jgi:hypothetical protein
MEQYPINYCHDAVAEYRAQTNQIVSVLNPLRNFICDLNPDNIFLEGRTLLESVVPPEWKIWIENTDTDAFLSSVAHVHRAFHSRIGPLEVCEY